MKHGYWTVVLGRRLRKDIENSGDSDLEVFYDHGEKGESRNIVPYFGKYGSDTTLSNLDIIIVSKGERRALVLCEFEEEGAKPKLVIGDIANIFIADRVRIRKNDYEIKDAKLLIGVRIKPKKSEKSKYAESKVESLGKLVPKVILKESLKGIDLQTKTSPDYDELVKQMEEVICEWLHIPVISDKKD